MASWFLADTKALAAYYGKDFTPSSLPRNPKVEQISRDDVMTGLKAATKSTSKGAYHKTRHAPHILAKLDLQSVRDAAPNCRRLCDRIHEHLAA